jgi:hypothetical protein
MGAASVGPLTNSQSHDNLATHSPGSDSDMPDHVDDNLDEMQLPPKEAPSWPLDNLSPLTPDACNTLVDNIQDLWD